MVTKNQSRAGLNETRVIERLNQKHSSGRKRVLRGQREIAEKGWRGECETSGLERGQR